ncbi:MAG: hypothetical protein PHH93_03190 [Prolixibacteraceae bacterium]|nr:hypothetical protein [Prolixibacteraceae bacterium]
MKKIFYIFATIAFTLTSCEKNDVEKSINSDEMKFAGLKVNLPANYNESVLSLSLSDLQNQFYTNNTGGIMKAKSSKSAGITLEEINQIIDGILIKYPKLDSLTTDEIEKINVNFPDLNSDEIVENINVIDSFYTSLVRYDLVQKLTETESKSSTKAYKVSSSSNEYYRYDLNSSEFWYFVWHPALASPIKKATEKANSLTESNYPESGKWRDKADAFRHAIWNVLICKYIGEDKNEISDCTKRADDFTTKHETGADKPSTMTDVDWELDKKMDLHNNAQGRMYFESVAWIVKVGWFKVKRVRAPSEDEIVSGIKNKLNSAQKISTSNDTSKYPNNLVYIKD